MFFAVMPSGNSLANERYCASFARSSSAFCFLVVVISVAPIFRSWDTAVTIWAGANGFIISTLLGTPIDPQSFALAPVMYTTGVCHSICRACFATSQPVILEETEIYVTDKRTGNASPPSSISIARSAENALVTEKPPSSSAISKTSWISSSSSTRKMRMDLP